MSLFSKKALDFEMVTTKGGDGGKSALYSGEFIAKNDIHFQVLGDIDELNSWLGVLRNAGLAKGQVAQLHAIQQLLYRIMSVVATNPQNRDVYSLLHPLKETELIELEHWQKGLLEETTIEARFVIPGEHGQLSAWCDLARAVARRAERSMVDFIAREGSMQSNTADLYLCQKYLNRLSDFLFILARYQEALG